MLWKRFFAVSPGKLPSPSGLFRVHYELSNGFFSLSATGCNGFSSTVLSLSAGHPSSLPLGIHFRLTSLVQTRHQRSRTRCDDSSLLARERMRYRGHPRRYGRQLTRSLSVAQAQALEVRARHRLTAEPSAAVVPAGPTTTPLRPYYYAHLQCFFSSSSSLPPLAFSSTSHSLSQ